MHRRSQNPRQAIRASSVEQGIEARRILDQVVAVPPLNISWNGSSIVLRLAALVFQLAIGETSGSIATGTLAAPTSGSVTLAKWTGSGFSTTGMPSVTAYNVWSNSSTAIGASKTVLLARIAGHWLILGWDC